MTLNEAAQRLGVSPPFLLKIIAEGGIPARRSGRRYFINWAAVLEWSKGVDTGTAPKRPRTPKAATQVPSPAARAADDVEDSTPPGAASAPPDPGDGG